MSPYDRIDVVVHPQSIVHSMVELTDGATLAQLSVPDMRLPIGYALGYPERLAVAFGPVDWGRAMALSFEPPDRDVFGCLDLAYAARTARWRCPRLAQRGERGCRGGVSGRCGIAWLAIAEVVAETLEAFDDAPLDSLEAVLEADRSARERATAALTRRGR